MPLVKEFRSKRVIFAKIYIKAKQIGDGGFHSVNDDIYELVRQHSGTKNGDLTKTYFCEYYYVDRLPRQMSFDCGGYVYRTIN